MGECQNPITAVQRPSQIAQKSSRAEAGISAPQALPDGGVEHGCPKQSRSEAVVVEAVWEEAVQRCEPHASDREQRVDPTKHGAAVSRGCLACTQCDQRRRAHAEQGGAEEGANGHRRVGRTVEHILHPRRVVVDERRDFYARRDNAESRRNDF